VLLKNRKLVKDLRLILVVMVLFVSLSGVSFTMEGDGVIEPVAPINPTPTPETSWLILPEMSQEATQADYGAEIYRLVCQDCHGDRGQGLTDEFRATWAPKDQNCWQSKCHASNHPPDGFDLPRYVPAVIGPAALPTLNSPDDLHAFIQRYMPWHNPGALTDEEYWQLTAFLLRENSLAIEETKSKQEEFPPGT
jgi:hypothetical protein